MKAPRQKPSRKRPPRRLHPEIIKLLDDIEEYCERHECSRTHFGIAAANDGHLIRRLEEGRLSTLRTIERVRSFLGST